MKLNLFSSIIISLNYLLIKSNFVYASALKYDSEVEVIEGHVAVKRNITEVKQPDFEEDENENEKEKFRDELPGVQFPRQLYLSADDPCEPSPCGMNFWPWMDYFNNHYRFICLPNYVKSPPKCSLGCDIFYSDCSGPPKPSPCLPPSSCGPHSECRELFVGSTDAICRCQRDLKGLPPNCRWECTINSECDSDKACINRICADPCVYKCARNANCRVIAHNPICSCQDGFAGDPFTNCMPLSIPTQRPAVNPCIPSPCGPFSQCREFNGNARCTCLPNYSSSPPRCSLECSEDSQCNAGKACINNRCIDPCPTVCGNYAQCIVIEHAAYCTCLPDSCQALDQTFDFPRYPKLDYIMESRSRETGLSAIHSCGYVCDSFVALCPSGTSRVGSICVEHDK